MTQHVYNDMVNYAEEAWLETISKQRRDINSVYIK